MKKNLCVLGFLGLLLCSCRFSQTLDGTLVDPVASSIDGARGKAHNVPSNIHSGTIFVAAQNFSVTDYDYVGDENFDPRDSTKFKGELYQFKIDPDQ